MEPKPMAITVQTKQMTLYGMLKSGVGRETSRGSVCSRRTVSLHEEGGERKCLLNTAAHVWWTARNRHLNPLLTIRNR